MRNLFLITALFILSPFMYANIFFDDFDGNDLADWWSKQGGNWEYEVSDSMLKVNKLWGGPFDWSHVQLRADIPAFNDFEMVAKVGWDPGLYQSLHVEIYNSGYETPSTGGLGFYNKPNDSPYVVASFNGIFGNSISVPDYGMHEFRFARLNKVLYAYFDGELFDQKNDKFPFKTEHIRITFAGKDLDEFSPMYVDWIQVVPEPMTIVTLSICLALLCKIRRK